MFSLLYPSDPAPLLGTMVNNAEMMPVTEPGGLVVGRACRDFIHGGSLLLHPVVHLHIINRQSKIYLQRRGLEKKLYPGLWDTAVGGHVAYGEQMEEALYREAAEELDFRHFNPVLIKVYEFEGKNERELIGVYAAISSKTPKPDGFEVTEGRWWTDEEIRDVMGSGLLTPNFEQEYSQIKDTLFSLL